MTATLLLVGHGTRDPEGMATLRGLVGHVRRTFPDARVQQAYLDVAGPTVVEALAAAPRGPVAVVPLLLSTGVHVRADIPRAVAAHRPDAVVARHLGPHPHLAAALADHLTQVDAPPGGALVLAAAGSSDPRAAGEVKTTAALLAIRTGRPVRPAFVAAARPTVAEVVAGLRGAGAHRVAVSSYLLAPGHFHQQVATAADGVVAPPIGGHPALVDLVHARCAAALRAAGTALSQ